MSWQDGSGTYRIEVKWVGDPKMTYHYFSEFHGAKVYWETLADNQNMENAICHRLVWRLVDMKIGEVSI